MATNVTNYTNSPTPPPPAFPESPPSQVSPIEVSEQPTSIDISQRFFCAYPKESQPLAKLVLIEGDKHTTLQIKILRLSDTIQENVTIIDTKTKRVVACGYARSRPLSIEGILIQAYNMQGEPVKDFETFLAIYKTKIQISSRIANPSIRCELIIGGRRYTDFLPVSFGYSTSSASEGYYAVSILGYIREIPTAT
ncbi:MAG: hypothetical protein QXG39_01920 [Candidatus Aenigmatarchaeota archaeon]